MPTQRRPTPPDSLLFAVCAAFLAVAVFNAAREDAKRHTAAKVVRQQKRKTANLAAIDAAMWQYPVSSEGE